MILSHRDGELKQVFDDLEDAFTKTGVEVLSARSVDNLSFSQNMIKGAHFPAVGRNAWIDLTDCSNVRVKKNLFDSHEPPTVNAVKMDYRDITSDMEVNFRH